MADILLPPEIRISQAAPRLIDSTSRFPNPLTGFTRTVARTGDRWGFSLTYNSLNNLNGNIEKARMEAFIAAMRGAANRALFSPVDYIQRGTFPSSELFPNSTFASGTSGWTGAGALSVSDFVMRAPVLYFDGASQFQFLGPSPASIALTQYAPYIFRALTQSGPGQSNYRLVADHGDGSGDYAVGSIYTDFGLKSLSFVAQSTTGQGWIQQESLSGTPGDYIDITFISLSRCALIDNSPNLLLQSDGIEISPWTRHGSGVPVTVTSPEGLSTGRLLTEDSSTGTHYAAQSVTVPSAAQDLSFTVALKGNTRSWAILELDGASGVAQCWFNLSTGVVGTSAVGTGWGNIRSFIAPLGNGWFKCTIVSRKTNSNTSISALVYMATADNVSSYAGNGTSSISVWRATLAQSSVPTSFSRTTSSATSGTSQSGSGINLKGLPASTSGLLKAGDWCAINAELKKVTAPLNSDAAGLAFLEFSPPIKISAADNDPLIMNKPMGRFILKDSENGWNSTPGIFSDLAFDLIED